MSTFDIDAALRWFRFDPRRPLRRRGDDALPFLHEEVLAGPGLLLDTCVYIDQLQNRTPDILDRLVSTRPVNHSTIAVQELVHSVGVLNPEDRRSSGAIAEISSVIRAMKPHRLFAPDPDTLGRAAMLAGLLCRLQGYARDARLRALSDATLLLQAQKLGLTVLTRNISDFDLMTQLLPRNRVLFYRTR